MNEQAVIPLRIDMQYSVRCHTLRQLETKLDRIPSGLTTTKALAGLVEVEWYNLEGGESFYLTFRHPEIRKFAELVMLSKETSNMDLTEAEREDFSKHRALTEYTPWEIENGLVRLWHSGAICERNDYRAGLTFKSFPPASVMGKLLEEGLFGYFILLE